MNITEPGPFKGLNEHPLYKQFRDMSYVELFFFWRTQLDHYSNYRILVEYNEELTTEKVYHALTRMMYKYSALTMDLMPSSTSKFGHQFVVVDEVRLSDVVEFIQNDKLANVEEILEKYHKESLRYGKNKPLWRLKVINGKYALFFCNHILYDGTSGKNFHIELSKEIANGIPKIISGSFTGLDSIVFEKSMVEFDQYQLPPSPVDIIDYNKPYSGLLYIVLAALLPTKLSNLIKRWFSGNPYTSILAFDEVEYKSFRSDPKNTSSSRVINLDSFQLNSLIKTARLHNVKLTSLITVLAHISMGKFIASSGKDTVTSIPINIRGSIKMEKANKLCNNFSPLFGLYMGAIRLQLPSINKLCPDGQINWSLATFVNKYIHENISTSRLLLGVLKFINIKRFIVKEHEKEKKATFELSNLGQIGAEHKNIIGAWFDQPGCLFSANMISCGSGGTIVLRCCNEEWVDEFRNRLEKNILSLLPDEEL